MDELIKDLRKFNSKRNWEKYHTPKNLAMALSVEVSELVEIFQWLTEDESKNLSDDQLKHLKEEIGDVFLYLLNLSDKFNIDVIQVAQVKMLLNAKKYPI